MVIIWLKCNNMSALHWTYSDPDGQRLLFKTWIQYYKPVDECVFRNFLF